MVKVGLVKYFSLVLVVAWVLVFLVGSSLGEDWPTYRHDISRSGVSSERLEMPLEEHWRYVPRNGPCTAWPEPAKQDYWHRISSIAGAVNYDRAFHVAVVGERVYFGSSSDDKVYALDSESGREEWSFFTGGPVRLCPSVTDGKVYVGSDDGFVYCLSAADGKELWNCRAVDKDYMLAGNGRVISLWPIRTGVVVDDGTAYFASGFFPVQGVFLCALNSADGTLKWKEKVDVSAQGYMLASSKHLYVPTGRTSPAIFGRSGGKSLGGFNTPGGTFALVVDDVLVNAPGRGEGAVAVSNSRSRENIATFNGLGMVVAGSMAYMYSQTELSALNRTKYLELTRKLRKLGDRRKEKEKLFKKEKTEELEQEIAQMKEMGGKIRGQMEACQQWSRRSDYPFSLILGGDILFAGGQDKVAAINTADGEELWRSEVQGRAYGLAVANGKLFVSTDKGIIYCFGDKGVGRGGAVITAKGAQGFAKDDLTAVYFDAARRIVEQMGITKGYCLDVGCGSGRLALEMAKLTELKIVGVEEDATKVAAARKSVDTAGLYGRIAVHEGRLENMGYKQYLFNLVVSDRVVVGGSLPSNADEVFRVVRPYGGTVYLGYPAGARSKLRQSDFKKWAGGSGADGWKVIEDKGLWLTLKRGVLAGGGEWTHQYADAGNTASSMDELVKGRMAVQWYGEPGPRDMIDRHHRNVLPLFKNGRLFAPGDDIVYAMDAYNGTIEWEIRIPNSRRLGVFLDCGSMVVDDDFLYVAVKDKCYGYDVVSGVKKVTHTMPQLVKNQQRYWGYLAYSGDMLFGSGRKQDAVYTETSREADSALWYLNMKLVTSDYLFSMERKSGKVRWEYKDGLIVNTTITVGGGRVYFIESSSAEAKADKSGRMPLKKICEGGEQYLVALDAVTGKRLYKKKVDVSSFSEVIYINYAKGILIFSGSKSTGKSPDYSFYAIDAATGDILWHKSHPTTLPADGGHGELNRHPTIVGDVVYVWPYAYKLGSGEKIEGWEMSRRGHGCGGVSASAYSMFWRGHNPWMYDLRQKDGAIRLNKVARPGCWINIIPAGGLVLIPESSSGCTCGYALQSSMAYAPVESGQ